MQFRQVAFRIERILPDFAPCLSIQRGYDEADPVGGGCTLAGLASAQRALSGGGRVSASDERGMAARALTALLFRDEDRNRFSSIAPVHRRLNSTPAGSPAITAMAGSAIREGAGA